MNDNDNALAQPSHNIVQSAAALALALGKPRSWAPESQREVGYVLLKDADGAQQLEYLEPPQQPNRPVGTYQLDTIESFNNFVSAHAITGVTACYLRPSQIAPKTTPISLFKALAVINEHEKDAGAGFRDFRAQLDPPTSESFRLWMGQNGKVFDGNEDFAEFLEDSFAEIVEPSGAAIFELAQNFHVKQEVSFGNPVSLDNGAQKLTIHKSVTGGGSQAAGSVVIPKRFVVEIPVLRGDERKYRFEAKFRYRLGEGGRLSIWYDFVRPDLVIEAAIRDAVEAIAKGSGVPVYMGAADFGVK